LTQSDNQVRAAIAAALGDFKGDEGAFSTETKLLQSDPSYAIHAATAIGASGSSDPFDVLSEHADAAAMEIHRRSATERKRSKKTLRLRYGRCIDV
jgi:hypothetical protein